MIAGALVLPVISVGMIDASATRRPCRPHAQLVVDHRELVVAHLAGAHRMEHGAQVGADPGLDLAAAGNLRARYQLALEVTGEAAAGGQFADQLETPDQGIEVGRVAEEIGFDQRPVVRVRRVQADPPAALRVHHRDVQADPVAEGDQALRLVLQRGATIRPSSGVSACGSRRRKPPDSTVFEVSAPRRPNRYCQGERSSGSQPFGEKPRP